MLGTLAQSYYYGPDQIGSVRRIFASTSNAPAYGYDPYGAALQATAPLTDYNFAGMLFNADSGLNLTQYRAYDPVAGRWLSRDPIGESSDAAANLYAYVGGNPVRFTDQFGLEVDVCHRQADLPFPMNLFDHYWVRTDSYEAGMGGMKGVVPAQNGNSDWPYDRTQTVDHSGQSKAPNAFCDREPDVDEECVNEQIAPGQPTGRWTPINQCHTFANQVINRCRRQGTVVPDPIPGGPM